MGVLLTWIGIAWIIKYIDDRRIRWYKPPKIKEEEPYRMLITDLKTGEQHDIFGK